MDFYLSRIGANRLYSNDGDRTFTEVAAAAGVDDVNQGSGSAWADYDNDGDPDLYVPNRNPANNNLYRNNSDGTFTDVAAAAGVDDASFSQGAAWADFDSDGDLDVVITNVTSAGRTYRNNGNGTFTDIAIVAGIDGGGSATGTSWADYDGDGDLDLFVARELAPNHLFRNNGNSNNWMGVKLAGTVAGKSGIGSIVSVFSGAASYRRDVSGGSGYHGSQPSQIQTFGLGGTSFVDSIKVWWATGQVQVESNVSINQVTTITEPALNTVVNVGVSTANALFIGWIDYDGDSDLDIHVSPGGGATPKLYRNDGAGSFTDVAASMNLTETDQPLGIGWGDYDSDGDPDLYLALNGVNRLHRNDGGTFTSVGAAAGVDDNGVGYTGLWGDYDNDGDLDIHVASYAGANPDRLYRNDGSGTFSEVGNAAGVDDTGNGRASSWADYDDDGDLDLYLARDGQANRLYRNQGDLTFTDVAGNAGVNVDHAGRGTGSVWADYDNDGDLDLYLTNQDAGVGNALYRNEGSGQFKEIAAAVGVKDEAETTNSVAWVDFDNDGDVDLYNGNNLNLSVALFLNRGNGAFSRDVGFAVGVTHAGQLSSAAWGDYDDDGDLDLYISRCCGGSTILYQNQGNSNRWLHVKTTGTAGNRDGYGALVTAVTGSTRQLRQVESSAADGTQASPPVEFGFGSTTTVDSLIVQWQAGFETVQTNVSTNQILTVTEPTAFFTEVAASASVADAGEGEGVAWGDYDSDGDQDLYVTNFSQANKLYSNDGDGTFTDVGGTTADAGAGTGTVWGDYDNDGDLDLYLVQYSSQANKLFRNDGGGTFTDVSAAPINDAGSGNSASWSDYDKDGDLDFYLANDSGGTNRLFNNNGSGTFTDVGGTTGTSDNGYDVAWGDYDDDGDPDLYLSVSGGANKLFRNDGGTFTDVSASPVNDGGAGRGVAWADYDNDGDLDLYQAKTSAPNPNEVYRNEGGGSFSIVTSAVLEDVSNGHGIGWTDYNNDGDLDLFLANLGTPNRLFDNDGTGKFKPVEVGAGVPDAGNSRGTAFADYDGDGDMDLYVVNGTGTPNRLYRNNGNSNKWLQVELKGTKSTTKGVGAKVEVVTGTDKQRRDVDGGSGYYSQPSLPIEFGTGLFATIDSLIVTWLSGGIQILTGVATNQSLTLTEFYASTPVAGLSGETKVGSGGEVQLLSIGINGGSPSNMTGITLTLSDLSTATGLTAGEIAELRLYRSTNAVFDAGDTKIGTQSAVNLGSATTVNPTATETPASGAETFYIGDRSDWHDGHRWSCVQGRFRTAGRFLHSGRTGNWDRCQRRQQGDHRCGGYPVGIHRRADDSHTSAGAFPSAGSSGTRCSRQPRF